MKKFLSFEGPVASFLSRLADLILLNILFIVCSIPFVTIGASATAMYYVTLKMVKDEESYIIKSFFKSFKMNFKQATVIWMIFAVIIMVVVTDLVIVNGGTLQGIVGNEAISSTLLIAIGIVSLIIVFILTYVFALLAQFDNTIVNTIKNSFLISIRHLPYTVVMIVISIIPWVILYFVPQMMILIFVVFSLLAYINSTFFNKIFVLYMPKSPEESSLEALAEDEETDVNATIKEEL